MDRSMDSIGSCSLDVDAESSDISDTSGSLNFPTPISIKDITREFTNNIRERCSLQTVKNTTAYVDPVTGQVCIALTQPTATTTATVNNNVADSHNQKPLTTTTTTTSTTTLLTPQTPEDSYDKKPSYLNLACCVNGYSNITTYDSKIRQDINKSREVSPIRPSSTSLQYCKKGNSLAPPVLLAMPNVNLTSPQQQQPTAAHQMTSTNGVYVTSATIGSRYSIVENNNRSQNGLDSTHNTSDDGGGGGNSSGRGVTTIHRSFIQQRVERLYGPGALAQGFYSPKKIKDSSMRLNKSDVSENGGSGATSELARKFQELSPSKDYNQFRKKLSTNGRPPIPPPSTNANAAKEDNTKLDNNNIDLPCLRHLSQEFRAQLPVVSPKRNFSRTSPGRDTTVQPQTHKTVITNGTAPHTMANSPPSTASSSSITVTTQNTTSINTSTKQIEQDHYQSPSSSSSPATLKTSSPVTIGSDELDHKVVVSNDEPLEKLLPAIKEPKVILPAAAVTTNGSPIEEAAAVAEAKPVLKDAHFFLKQLKEEQNRLLIMAAQAEKYLEDLTSNSDIHEDVLGLLRSASGKARLLVSQKMKQFEGLCHNNLNSSPEDQFPTTVDDLQGFWDMVYLQVDHVDSIFAEIENLKNNDWKKPVEVKPTATVNVLKTPRGNKTPLISKYKPPSTPMANGGAGSVTATPSAAALKREAQRKKLQEMKRRNREAMAAASANASSNTNSTTNETSTIEIVGINETLAAQANS